MASRHPASLLLQDQNALLRLLQLLLALARQLHAALEMAEGLVQRQVAGLHAAHEGLELGQRRFEAGFLGLLAHRRTLHISGERGQTGSLVPRAATDGRG